jgi:hypothetical protein
MKSGMRIRDRETMRAYMRLMHMSERTLAIRAGVGHATVNHLLSGRRTRCSPRTASAIATVLACPEEVFFARVGQ